MGYHNIIYTMRIPNRINIRMVGIVSWCALGSHRGIQEYNYLYNEDLKKCNIKNNKDTHQCIDLNPDPPENIPKKYVVGSFIYGMYGSVSYLNPFFAPFYVAKEIYRLEVNLRNFDYEKTTKYYNTLDIYWNKPL